MNCGDEREIVARGLCAKCYMANRRAGERLDDPFGLSPDHINRRYIAERNKMLVNLTRIIKLVDETPCLSHEDTATIKVTIQPYLLERANDLAPKKSDPELTVNTKSESNVNSNDRLLDAGKEVEAKLTAKTDSDLTVNSEPQHEPKLTANTEIEPTVNSNDLPPDPEPVHQIVSDLPVAASQPECQHANRTPVSGKTNRYHCDDCKKNFTAESKADTKDDYSGSADMFKVSTSPTKRKKNQPAVVEGRSGAAAQKKEGWLKQPTHTKEKYAQ